MNRLPLYSFGSLALFVVAIVLLLLFGDTSNNQVILFVGTLLANVPGLVAAFMSERGNTAIRNGVVTEKAREGAVAALTETGVVEAVKTGPLTTQAFVETLNAHTTALTQILTEKKNNGPTL